VKRRAIILALLVCLSGKVSAATLTIIHTFESADGQKPVAGLVQGSDGNFYGTTQGGGTDDTGTVFRISSAGTFTSLHSFDVADGDRPVAALIPGFDGNFYGTAQFGGAGGSGTVFRIDPAGVTFTNLYQFSGPDGSAPIGGLVQGSDSNFYGTTSVGGTNGNNGTVFKISATGALTTLYEFSGSPDGSDPTAALVQGSDGYFYGTTKAGGTGNAGIVFRISPAGAFTNLYNFSGGVDGNGPAGGLVQGVDGFFYGTTVTGGTIGRGVVFKINSAGVITNLHNFSGSFYNPQATLVQGSDGDFYGTTTTGNGSVFRISPSGTFTNLSGFPVNSGDPNAGVVQGIDGYFYGTALNGGTNCAPFGCGTLYQLSTPLDPPANQVSGIQLVGTNVVMTIPSVAGNTYQLQDRDSMTTDNWANVGGPITSGGGLLAFTNVVGALPSQLFFRLAITP
jgi:uncharacterized repeat protein (TIGR03803 family)